jgi:hypothetical protein
LFLVSQHQAYIWDYPRRSFSIEQRDPLGELHIDRLISSNNEIDDVRGYCYQFSATVFADYTADKFI